MGARRIQSLFFRNLPLANIISAHFVCLFKKCDFIADVVFMEKYISSTTQTEFGYHLAKARYHLKDIIRVSGYH